MKNKSTLVLTAFLISACLCSITFASPTMRIENGVESAIRIVPDNYPSIQAAIYASNAGDQVMVRNGTYVERVLVNQTVSLYAESESGAIVDGLSAGTCFTVTANNVSISGFVIKNSASNANGIYLNNANGSTIQKNKFVNNFNGIRIAFSGNNRILNNDISSSMSGSRGVDLGTTGSNTVVDNLLHENQFGIVLTGSCYNDISRNRLSGNRDSGILVQTASNFNIIRGNNVTNSTTNGVAIASSTNNIVTNNDVSSSSTSSMGIAFSSLANNNTVALNNLHENQNGIYATASSYNNLTKNMITANRDTGIYIDYPNSAGDSNFNVITSNNITGNAYYGLRFRSYYWNYKLSNNTMYHNNFDNNTRGQVWFYYVGSNAWDNGYPLPEGGGNYWNDYRTRYPDAKPRQDGEIWDTPYVLDVNNIDRYPLIKAYVWWEERNSTMICFDLVPNPASVGKIITLIGNLTTTQNSPIANANVTLKLNGGEVGKLVTNATGWFKASGQVWSGGIFNITAEYAGSTLYFNCSSWKILTVKVSTEIYARFIPNLAPPGATVTLKGILVDQSASRVKYATVSLQYSSDFGLTWIELGTVSTDSYGIFSKTYTAPSIGTYIYRMNYTGSSTHMPCTTDITLVVR